MSNHAEVLEEIEEIAGDGAADPLLGSIADGRYRVDRKAGEGGFGTVYAATHLALGAPVALKVLRPRPDITEGRRAELVARFMDEARMLPRLRHPNIVAALDLGVLHITPAEPTPYLVMEWCVGSTLRAALVRSGPLPLPQAWRLLEPVLDAMAFAHGLGVVHRDLKPANVMLDTMAGRTVPRIIDFGLAKVVEDAVFETGLDSVLACTPAYAAPEQLCGGRTGAHTDVHALALIFTEMICGRSAFGVGRGARADLRRLRPSPASLGIDAGAFEPVLVRALALQPDHRHADADELGEALRQAARDMGLGAEPAPGLEAFAFEAPPEAVGFLPRTASASAGFFDADEGASHSQMTSAYTCAVHGDARCCEGWPA